MALPSTSTGRVWKSNLKLSPAPAGCRLGRKTRMRTAPQAAHPPPPVPVCFLWGCTSAGLEDTWALRRFQGKSGNDLQSPRSAFLWLLCAVTIGITSIRRGQRWDYSRIVTFSLHSPDMLLARSDVHADTGWPPACAL